MSHNLTYFLIQVITLDQAYRVGTYMLFYFWKNVTFDVFILDKGAEIELQTQMFLNVPSSFTIEECDL